MVAALDEDERSQSLLDGGVGRLAAPVLDGARTAIEQIGSYRLVRVLGEGGMGTVFLAERVDLGTNAAIKILRDAWLSPSRRRRFATEQRTLAALNHPGIARLFDAGVLEDGTPWIVMEYVDGQPITTTAGRIATRSPRSFDCFATSAPRCSSPIAISSSTAT